MMSKDGRAGWSVGEITLYYPIASDESAFCRNFFVVLGSIPVKE